MIRERFQKLKSHDSCTLKQSDSPLRVIALSKKILKITCKYFYMHLIYILETQLYTPLPSLSLSGKLKNVFKGGEIFANRIYYN